MPVRPGTVALVCTVIGTTTFDGFSNGGLWRKMEPSVQSAFGDLGFHQVPALELAYTVGLLLCVAVIIGIYRLGIEGVRSVSHRYGTAELVLAGVIQHSAMSRRLMPLRFSHASPCPTKRKTHARCAHGLPECRAC